MQSATRAAKPGVGRAVSPQAAAVGLARTMRSIDTKLDAAHRKADKLLAEIKAMNAR